MGRLAHPTGFDTDVADMEVDYYPFEDYQLAGGGEDTKYKFTGYHDDSGIGFHYARARFYHPGIGRFLTPDPARQYFSPYTYVGNQSQ